MRVSVNWLRELVAVDMPVEALARALTMGGLEVEEITPVAASFSGIVVGHVKSVSPHPNADKLRVTEVDAGTGEILGEAKRGPTWLDTAFSALGYSALNSKPLPSSSVSRAGLRSRAPRVS